MKQSYLEIFENETGNITIRYAIPDGDQLDVQMIEVHEDDLMTIADELKRIALGD